MISKKAFITYAQYNEDIILLALLPGINNGFYVDVGANYPVIDSVTKLFYDKGWRGINIEPIPSLYRQLARLRPKDINLPIGVSDKKGELEFFENVNIPGHSSFSRSDAEQADARNIATYKVKISPLRDIFATHRVETIHFLKIDVEGLEEAVIKGNDWKKYRPYIICIEANHRTTLWQDILLKNNYKLFINDGLNEYYVAKEEWVRTEGFAERAVELNYHALNQQQYQSWKQDSLQLKRVTKLNQTHHQMVEALRQENARLRYENRFSLVNRSYHERLKRSVKGLTVDWWQYRKRN